MKWPRFTVASLMLLMLVVAVAASGGYHLRRALREGTQGRAMFVIFTLAAPVALLATMSLFHWVKRLLRRDRKYRRIR